MRPWLNWIEQQISNLWVAGSSPAGRATKFKPTKVSVLILSGATKRREPSRVAKRRQVRQ